MAGLKKDISIQDIPQPYNSIIKQNFKIISNVTDESLSRYFEGCFNDVYRMVGLYKTWVCVACLSVGKHSFGWGDKPDSCPVCEKTVYEVGTFQARASYVGNVFDYACQYLLNEKYDIDTNPTAESTRLYDFEIRNDIVVESKGSPKYVINPDGTRSSLDRAGLLRSDTEKKAFANATKWRRLFPNGTFFIITNALPNHLRAYRNDKVTAIYDITKKSQLDCFVSELRTMAGL